MVDTIDRLYRKQTSRTTNLGVSEEFSTAVAAVCLNRQNCAHVRDVLS